MFDPPGGAAALLIGHLGFLACLALWSAAVGRRVLSRCRFAGRGEGAALSITTGLVVLAQAVFLLAASGVLHRQALLVAVLALLVVTAPSVAEALRWIGTAWRSRRFGGQRATPASLARGLAVMLALATPIALALYPPTAFDATSYHLPFARGMVAEQGLVFADALRFPVFPQLAEMLFTAALLFGNDVDAQLVQALATILTALLLFAWGSRIPGAAGVRWLAPALFLGNPLVAYLGGTAYVDALLALLATASLFALDRFTSTREWPWAALAGVMAGAAASVKYSGLFFVAAVVVATLFTRDWRASSRSLLAALAILLPWYARIAWTTGNPVFPYFPSLFGPSPWDPTWLSGPPGDWGTRLLTLPWTLVWERERWGRLPPVSPAYLLSCVLLAAVPFGPRLATGRAGLVALAFAPFAVLLGPDPRYLAPALPVASLVAAEGWARLLAWHGRDRPAWTGAAVSVLASLLFLPGPVYAVYRSARQGPIPADAHARETYLARQLPLYPAIAHLNRIHDRGETLYLFHAENMVDLVLGRTRGDWNGPARFGLLVPAADAATLAGRLRLFGADHFLVPAGRRRELPADFPADAFRRVYADAAAELFEVRPASTAR